MKNNKGFTMVELLAAIAILALLVVMAFPTMRALQGRNEKQKYEEYGKSMVSAAKLYTDSYAEDLFPREYKNEFAIISSEDLEKKDLLKKIGFNDVSCINSESFIAVAKYGDDYQYCLSLKCKNKSGNIVYEETNKEGICKTYDTIKVIYEYDPGGGLPKRTHPDPIIKGDDTYYALNPSKFGNFDFSANHQVFEGWVKQGTTERIGIGDKINPSDLKSNLTLTADFRPFKYKVDYSANGGTGTVTEHWCNYGANCTLRANGYTFKGHTFQNWKDGSEKTYNAGQPYKNLVSTDGGSITLSANWRKNRVYVLYNANGGSLTNPYLRDFTLSDGWVAKNNNIKFFDYSYGGKLTVDGLIDYNNPNYVNLSRTGYTVPNKEEWVENANGTGTTYDMSYQFETSKFCDASNGDCTKNVYVNWKPKTINVTFNCNGGTGGGTQTFVYGTANQAFNKTCTRTGYTMTGWNTKADGTGTSYATASSVSNDWINTNSPAITLYAKWQYNECTTVNVVWNQEFPTDQQIINNDNTLTNLASVTTYRWDYEKKECGSSGDRPYRSYKLRHLMCRCTIDKLTRKYCGTSEHKDVTSLTHSSGHAHIYYHDNDNGKKACNGDYNVNSYVRLVCKKGKLSSSSPTLIYHGYVFFWGAVQAPYNNFSPNKYWTHNGGDHNDRVPKESTNTQACNHACKALY